MTSASSFGSTGAPTIFGRPIVHIGYTVESIPDAVDFLAGTLGAGPFFLMKDIRIPVLRNANGPIIWDHSAAFGQWGNVGIELQQIDKLEPADAFGPTYQRTSGVNHVAYLADDLAQERARLEEMGLPLLFEASNGPHESLLFDAPLLGHTIEVHQDFALFQQLRAVMVASAEGWDGSDPLRPVPRALQETLASADV
ncbi:VOC family protein [Amycolatopsis pithecellobii]|uniref:VOC family protein n=1 Tax=Amycolatopsis pithecellobii TaxID=664692 RepID=UPI0012B9C012|nr:VOC family protein [Amycolatopsis pithecellobii]